MDKMRIAKYLAKTGVASRRQGEALIAEGRVKLNDVVVTDPVTFVKDSDEVTLDNKLLRRIETTRVWAFYKPPECITSRIDEQGRQTVYDLLPPSFKNMKYVGRLDYLSEGLLLLTNDGAFSRMLELPKNKLPRVYRVRVFGKPIEEELKVLAKGIHIDGYVYAPIEATVESSQSSNTWIKITLHEGKNREIRRVMEYLGYRVNRLIRVSYGPFELGGLHPGKYTELSSATIQSLLNSLT